MNRVGHGVAELPVVSGEVMGGYDDRRGGLAGTLDALEVHAIVIEGSEPATPCWALVVADLICVNEDVVEQVREALRMRLGIQGAWVAATHTHSGPESGCRPGGTATPAHVASRLVEAAVIAAGEAINNATRARICVRRVHVAGLAGDRTARAAGMPDLPVDVIIAATAEKLVGLVVITPAHPTVMGAENTSTSADLSGGIRRALLGRLSPARGRTPWVVSATGAAGDISTRFTRHGRVPAEVDRLGALVADAVEPALDGFMREAAPAARQGRPSERGHAPAQAATATVALDPKALPAAATTSGPEDVSPESGDARVEHVVRQGVEIASRLRASGPREGFRVRLSAVQVDGATLVAVPGELFLSLGEDIRRRSPRPLETVVLGYVNGYLGYLPTRDAAVGYEVLVSPVAEGSGEQLADAAVALTHRISDIEEQERSVG
jgi:hypothetical protein